MYHDDFSNKVNKLGGYFYVSPYLYKVNYSFYFSDMWKNNNIYVFILLHG